MNLYQSYAKAWLMERKYHEKRVALKSKVKQFVSQTKSGKVENDFGTFLLVDVDSYYFSDKVDKLMVKLIELKEKEKAEGIAVKKTDRVLRYLPR